MSTKLVNGEKNNKNKLNKTYELFVKSVKELNKLISDKDLEGYEKFLSELKEGNNTFDKAVAEAIDAVYVKNILDEEDIETGCPTDIVKFNKDYKVSKTKELLEGTDKKEKGENKMIKKNIIEESVKNNTTDVKIIKKDGEQKATYRDYIISHVNIVKDVLNKVLDDFVSEVKESDKEILNVEIDKDIITEVDTNFSELVSTAMKNSSFIDELIEPFKELIEVNKKGVVIDGSKITIPVDNMLAYVISSVVCKEVKGNDIILDKNTIEIEGDKITGELAVKLYDAIINLLDCKAAVVEDEDKGEETKTVEVKEQVKTTTPEVKEEKTEEPKQEEKQEEVKVEEEKKTEPVVEEKKNDVTAVSYKININSDKIILNINSSSFQIDKQESDIINALAVIEKALEYSKLSTTYKYAVLSNFTKALFLQIIKGEITNFELSKLVVKADLDSNAKTVLE